MAIESSGHRGSLSSSCPLPAARTAPPGSGRAADLALACGSHETPLHRHPSPLSIASAFRHLTGSKQVVTHAVSEWPQPRRRLTQRRSGRLVWLPCGTDGVRSSPRAAWGGARGADPSPARCGGRARPPSVSATAPSSTPIAVEAAPGAVWEKAAGSPCFFLALKSRRAQTHKLSNASACKPLVSRRHLTSPFSHFI